MQCIIYHQQDFAGLKGCLKTSRDVPKTLIFCQTKDVVVKVYLALSQSTAVQGSISMYHGSLSEATKAVIQHQFQQSHTLMCVVATIAFGLVSIVSILTTMASHMSYTSPVYDNSLRLIGY